MNDSPQHVLLRVLPVLRDAHALLSGLPFNGTPESLAADLQSVVVKVDHVVRESMRNDPMTPEERLAFDTAIWTRIAMDNGSMPFDQARYEAAQRVTLDALRRGIERNRKSGEAHPRPPRRVGKH